MIFQDPRYLRKCDEGRLEESCWVDRIWPTCVGSRKELLNKHILHIMDFSKAPNMFSSSQRTSLFVISFE